MHSLIDLRKMDMVTLRWELEKAKYELNKIRLSVTSWKEKANHKVRRAKLLVAQINTLMNDIKFINTKTWDSKQV